MVPKGCTTSRLCPLDVDSGLSRWEILTAPGVSLDELLVVYPSRGSLGEGLASFRPGLAAGVAGDPARDEAPLVLDAAVDVADAEAGPPAAHNRTPRACAIEHKRNISRAVSGRFMARAATACKNEMSLLEHGQGLGIWSTWSRLRAAIVNVGTS